jgi:protein O-GlcNAc transferase
MKKIISFSLWGEDPKYLVGAIRNAELALEIYPGWICRYYIGSCVPQGVENTLLEFSNVEVVNKDKAGDWTGFFWRYAPASENDVEIMISRDTDSRLSLREKAAVDEWMKSDKGFHIMRDHPCHGFPVLGGMWGVKRGVLPNMDKIVANFDKENYYEIDYEFFAKSIIPLVKDNIMTHDEFFSGDKFPTSRDGYNFIGEVFNEHEETVEEHTQIIKDHINNG